MLSITEENHLKAIFHLSSDGNKDVSTNAIAEVLFLQQMEGKQL